ncbi:MAG: hypothetical protein U0Z53_26420 [Blastocatellia bacterium]
MSEILSYDEIRQRYPDEWLLITDAELDDENNLVRGRVYAHSSSRDVVYRAISDAPGDSFALEYTGEWPEDLALVL